MKCLSVFAFFGWAMLVCCPAAIADDWVDDWIQQSTQSLPNTYQTQRRGYVTGGKLSLRYQQQREHLVNVSSPSYKGGCGGIDLFGGAVNFLNPDLLQDHFENIISNSATYFFDIAMNTLCEPCAKEFKSLKALIDRLNQLQIDDCAAGKAVVAYAANATGLGDSEANTEAVNDFLVDSGFVDDEHNSYYQISKNSKGKPVSQVLQQYGISKQQLISGCPPDMRAIYFTEGTLLENLARQMGIDAGKVELMRAMAGDVYISGDLDYGAIAACPQNNPRNIDAVIYGDFYSRRNGQCEKVDHITLGGVQYPSVFDWARQNIIEVATGMAAKSDLSDANVLFINTVPQPAMINITIDMIMAGDYFAADAMADKYAYTASLIFAYSLLRDLYNDLYHMLYTAKIASFNQEGNADCAKQLSSKAQLMATEIGENVLKYSSAISDDYRQAMAEVMDNASYARNVKASRDEAKKIPVMKVGDQ
jgi:conjugative transfer pilus assembly protein TraH